MIPKKQDLNKTNLQPKEEGITVEGCCYFLESSLIKELPITNEQRKRGIFSIGRRRYEMMKQIKIAFIYVEQDMKELTLLQEINYT